MKIVKILATIIMVWMAFPSWAVCPGQGADVEFVNGVDTERRDAIASTTRLEKVVTEHPGVNSSCVDFNTSYNANEPYFIDFLEAGLQKAEELSGESSDFWKQYFRTVPALDWFNNLVVETLFVPINGAIGLGEYALGDQTLEHLAKYAEHTAPTTPGEQRKRLILVGHSQGSAVAVLEREKLSSSDKENTFVVSASAFTVPEPEHDRYTTLDKDNLASVVFAEFGAPLPNVPLESTTNCDNGNAKWYCHAFKETYLNIPESRNKIADDIVSFLSTQLSPSSILYDTSTSSSFATNGISVYMSAQVAGVPETVTMVLQGDFTLYDSAGWWISICGVPVGDCSEGNGFIASSSSRTIGNLTVPTAITFSISAHSETLFYDLTHESVLIMREGNSGFGGLPYFDRNHPTFVGTVKGTLGD
jgi:hypothetical protein